MSVSPIATPIIHFRNFYIFELTKVPFFIILLIDKWLIPVCSTILRGPRCVCRVSSCGQISSSVKLVFSSVATDLGWPEPYFLFMVPLSLKCFKSFLRMCKSSFWMNGLYKFYTQTNLFFIIVFNDYFVFFWKHHCEQIVTKRHYEQRGSSLTIYGNVM